MCQRARQFLVGATIDAAVLIVATINPTAANSDVMLPPLMICEDPSPTTVTAAAAKDG